MPVVTVSRLFGSGGGEVAERIARTLHWTLLDNAVVDAVAERLGVPTRDVSDIEERVPSVVERLARAMSLTNPQLVPLNADERQLDENQVIEVTKRVIEEAVLHGPVVVVGRGAQCLLAERADALHVFCHAPHSALVRRVASRQSLSLADAEKLVAEKNRQREQYVKRLWKREWTSARNYHLSIDTEWLGIEGTVELIVRIVKERFQLYSE